MKVSGTSHLSADREAVWAALNDPGVLVRTIPGCQRLEALGDDAYAMTLSAGVASIKGVYAGEVRLTDQQQPGSFRMHAQGSGAPGTIGADVLVTLAENADGGTDLTYDADAVVGGMIGGVGQRMLTGVSKKMATEFFANVEDLLAEPLRPERMTSDGSPVGRHTSWSPEQPRGMTSGGNGFAMGVAVGAAATLAGALVGGWLAGRRRGEAHW